MSNRTIGTPSTEGRNASFNTQLLFDGDSDTFQQGGTHAFTVAPINNLNLVGKIVRINQPTAVSFSADFIAHPDSAALDPTKLNVYIFVYFNNWNGSGTAKVVYKNTLFDAV